MFTTLYSKLAAVLLGLFAVLGAIAVAAALHFFELYNQESNQRLNRSLAQHLVQQNKLDSMSAANAARLRALFDMQMVINPSIQIYLLDASGRIGAFSAAPGEVKLARLDLSPVRRLLEPDARLPVFGDDPRNPGQRRIFSAAAIDGGQGYLYVMLARERPASWTQLFSQSHILPTAGAVAGISVLLALLAALGIFALMTRKLERLAAAMSAFEASNFSRRSEHGLTDSDRGRDEIDRLSHTFHEMAQRISSQLSRLRQNDQLRRELVANVSHDLKTPIATLQGYVDTLLLKDAALSPAERRNYLGIASRSCERLGKLIADLIELAKLDAQEITVQRETFSIGELVQDVAQKFELQADQQRVRLTLDFPARLPYVQADIGLIERVLENLIGNALTHTPAGGVVRLVIAAGNDAAMVCVQDTGCGIAEEDLPRIFERFFSAHNVSWERGAHAGLGLAITKSILDLHGSALTVASELGRGTTFKFSLPLATLGVVETNLAA